MTTQTSVRPMSSEHVQVAAYTPRDITEILLPDGEWQSVSNVELVQFAIAEAASPPAPQKLFPALRYTDRQSGKSIVTPMSKVISFRTRE